MDLHLSNISFQATRDEVTLAIARMLHNPPVRLGAEPPVNFHVELFHKKRSGVSVGRGRLSVADEEAARRLLQQATLFGGLSIHGRIMRISSERNPRHMMNETLLRRLRSCPYEDPASQKKRLDEMKGTVELTEVAFGRLSEPNLFDLELQYLAEAIEINPDRRQIIITFRHPTPTSRPGPEPPTMSSAVEFLLDLGLFRTTNHVVVHFSNVEELISCDRGFIALLRLEIAPSFECARPAIGLVRAERSAGPHDTSCEALTFVSTSLWLSFPNAAALGSFLRICRHNHMPRVQRRFLASQTKPAHDEATLRRLNEYLARLPLPVALELELLLRRRLLLPHSILELREEIDNVLSSHRNNVALCVQVFQAFGRGLISARNHPTNRHDGYLENISDIFEEACIFYSGGRFKKILRPLVQPLGRMQVYHALITPTSVFVEGPFVDQSNTTMRQFPSYEHHFLRVSIADEHGFRLRIDPEVSIQQLLLKRFRPFFADGLSLGGRHFRFLGYSQSALREHSTWFLCPFTATDGTYITAETIRRDSGTYKDIRCPARYGARLAQNFTATAPSVTLAPSEIVKIDDRTSSTGACMTDGCGTISAELMEDVADELGILLKSDQDLAAIQFRCGGAKGVAVLDTSLSGRRLCIRPSMQKFAAPKALELGIAKPILRANGMFLNRPLIQQLEGLGVPYSVFAELQVDLRDAIATAPESIRKTAALLSTHGLGTSFRLPSMLGRLERFASMGLTPTDGVYVIRDAFLFQSLSVAVRHILRELKYRARIPVPGSYTLVGVSDEYGCLDEGEIYACIRSGDGSRRQLLGKIVITRSPQEHPGDIQRAYGVDRKELEHLDNVVVFSCKGTRSLASCLGGGDLDGDEFNLIVDERLHPPQLFPPAAYIGRPLKTLDRDCTVDDIIDFLLEYISSDLLGYISIRRMQIADQSPHTIFDQRCLKLAELASHAVDYPKTGQPVGLREIDKPDSPLKPDFMAPESGVALKPSAAYYWSPHTLGMLFRNIDLIKDSEVWSDSYNGAGDDIDRALRGLQHRWGRWRLSPLRPPSHQTIAQMGELLGIFSHHLIIIAHSHTLSRSQTATMATGDREILSEPEIFVGSILYQSSDHRKRRAMDERLSWQTAELAGRTRDEIFADLEHRDEKMAAAYAAYEAGKKGESGGDGGVFGASTFKFLALECMMTLIKEADEEINGRGSKKSRKGLY